MDIRSINNNTGITDFKTGSNIRKAKRQLIRNDMSEAEKAGLRMKLNRAETAAENGKTIYANQIAEDVLDKTDGNVVFEYGEKSAEKDQYGTAGNKVGSRRYQDDSDDSSVSYQNPTALNEYQDELAVRAHEAEHVRHERWEAMKNDEIVQIQVRMKYSIDKSGERYLAGGETIVRKRKSAQYDFTKNLPK